MYELFNLLMKKLKFKNLYIIYFFNINIFIN